jgi:hypothetical protein
MKMIIKHIKSQTYHTIWSQDGGALIVTYGNMDSFPEEGAGKLYGQEAYQIKEFLKAIFCTVTLDKLKEIL